MPLTACQPGRGPPAQHTLRALLPPAVLPPAAAAGPQLRQGGAVDPAAMALQAGEEAGRPKPRGQWVAAVDEEEDAAVVEERRRLVAAHPHLLLLLQHPELQRCGACAACTRAGPPALGGTARRKLGSRACLSRQRFINDYQRQRQRARQEDEAAAGGGGSGGQARPQRSARGAGPLTVPLSGGVPESAALRVAAAYKLLYPAWQPGFLTEQRLADVAAALPAAAAALQQCTGGADGQGSSEGSDDERQPQQRDRREQPAKSQGNFFLQKQHERMQRLLDQLRGVGQPGSGRPRRDAQQQGTRQRPGDAGAGRAEAGSPGDLVLTQPYGTQMGGTVSGGATPGGTQPLPSQPGSRHGTSSALPSAAQAALGQQQPRSGRPLQQRQGWAPGRAGLAFVPAARPAVAGPAVALQPQAGGQPAGHELSEHDLERDLFQLPPDVQVAFRAGLSAGLPPAVVVAAVRRYHAITAAVRTAARMAEEPPFGGSGEMRRHRASHMNDLSSSGVEEDNLGTDGAGIAREDRRATAQQPGPPPNKRSRPPSDSA